MGVASDCMAVGSGKVELTARPLPLLDALQTTDPVALPLMSFNSETVTVIFAVAYGVATVEAAASIWFMVVVSGMSVYCVARSATVRAASVALNCIAIPSPSSLPPR